MKANPMFRTRRILTVSLVLFFLCSSSVFADVTPFTVWNLEARSLVPTWVQYWLRFMFLMAGIGIFFLKKHVEARWAVAAFVVTHVASGIEMLIFGADRFVVGMIAVNHSVFWTPVAIYMVWSLENNKLRTPYGVWLVGMTGVFTFSLMFDYADAYVYLRSFI